MKTIIQVPVEKKLRDQAEVVANDYGFSSLQDSIRMFLHKLAKREVTVLFADEKQLSPKAVRRYEKMIKDMNAGRSMKRFSSVKEFLADLHS